MRMQRLTCSVVQLVTKGILPWIKTSDILPSIHGSDHCPVYADFHDSITTPDGRTLDLWTEINPPTRSREAGVSPPAPPKFAARNYDEFSGKQRLLSSFFGNRSAATAADGNPSSGRYPSGSPSLTPMPETAPKPDPTPSPEEESGEIGVGTALKALRHHYDADDTLADESSQDRRRAFTSSTPSAFTGRPKPDAKAKDTKGKGKSKSSAADSASSKSTAKATPKGGQPTIQGFFKPPPKIGKKTGKDTKAKGKAKASPAPAPSEVTMIDDDDENVDRSQDSAPSTTTAGPATVPKSSIPDPASTQEDWLDDHEDLIANATMAEYNAEASATWSRLFTPKAQPKYVNPS